ncbi:hypothetical protein HPB50_016793 [Hyalomma asiaticum]|uniref:Uncharacterized protein n=1 Tax=Hyalomma asiaticum TaxID=266040 RepID=A0ACB7SGC3_HYAAI|nr:hypothetical protein HPB50_016793 [Hyalomma asiaticum]
MDKKGNMTSILLVNCKNFHISVREGSTRECSHCERKQRREEHASREQGTKSASSRTSSDWGNCVSSEISRSTGDSRSCGSGGLGPVGSCGAYGSRADFGGYGAAGTAQSCGAAGTRSASESHGLIRNETCAYETHLAKKRPVCCSNEEVYGSRKRTKVTDEGASRNANMAYDNSNRSTGRTVSDVSLTINAASGGTSYVLESSAARTASAGGLHQQEMHGPGGSQTGTRARKRVHWKFPVASRW